MYKNFIFFVAVFFFACSSNNNENSQEIKLAKGKELYKQCIVCHGEQAQKEYMGEVPPIKDIDIGTRFELMKAYREGTLGEKGIYGLAELKGEVMLNLSDEDMRNIDLYIDSIETNQ